MTQTRRVFLQSLFSLPVVAFFPSTMTPVPSKAAGFDVVAPEGVTYQWVRASLLGVPDIANVEDRFEKGWRFVTPVEGQFSAKGTQYKSNGLTVALGDVIERGGLVLMWLPTEEVKARQAKQKAFNDSLLPEMITPGTAEHRKNWEWEMASRFGLEWRTKADAYTLAEIKNLMRVDEIPEAWLDLPAV